MDASVKVACAQVEPVIFDRDATIDKVASRRRRGRRGGRASSSSSPRRSSPSYPSSRWARASRRWDDGDARRSSPGSRASRSTMPSAATERIGAIAREQRRLARGRRERARARDDLQRAARLRAGRRARPASPQADADEPRAAGLGARRRHGLDGDPDRASASVGGLICWENFMPLARVRALRSAASRSTSRRRRTTPRRGTSRSATSRARRARSSLSLLRLPARVELSRRRADRRRAAICSGAAARRSSARTASTWPVRCGTRKGSCTRSSIPAQLYAETAALRPGGPLLTGRTSSRLRSALGRSSRATPKPE